MSHSGDLRSTYIPFAQWSGIGGPYTFMQSLQREFERRCLELCESFDACDRMLFPIQYDLETLRRGKMQGKRFIVRLDGIWYPEKHGDAYHELNRQIEEIYNNYADLVIFQSDYCRRQCFEMFGELPCSRYRIIINGADQTCFFPSQSSDATDTIRLITTGNFRDAAMIAPVVEALDNANLAQPFRLHIVGPIKDELRQWLQRDYIVYDGSKTVFEVANLLRESDVFLYSHLNPPCPNSVIEAITTGLPVVGFDSGAMSELLPWSRDLLAPVNKKTFQSPQDLDSDAFRQAIETAAHELEHFKATAMDHANSYPFAHCADQYVSAIVKVEHRFEANQKTTVPGKHGVLGRLFKKVSER